MKVKLNSYLDIDNLKKGDLVYTPAVSKENNKFTCDFSTFKIKEFYTEKDKKYDKYSVVLQPVKLINSDGTLEFDEDAKAEIRGSLRTGYCTENTKKECLEAFKAEFVGVVDAINKTISTL